MLPCGTHVELTLYQIKTWTRCFLYYAGKISQLNMTIAASISKQILFLFISKSVEVDTIAKLFYF